MFRVFFLYFKCNDKVKKKKLNLHHCNVQRSGQQRSIMMMNCCQVYMDVISTFVATLLRIAEITTLVAF